jgi:ferritin-like metal-binding protein YciE
MPATTSATIGSINRIVTVFDTISQSKETLMAKDVKTMEDLFLEEIRDLYDAEKQIVKALPKLAKAATSEELSTAFTEHLEQTRGQIDRLERIFSEIGAKSGGVKCKGMEGLLKEGDEMVSLTEPGLIRDAGLIAAAQRVEHYEMAGYGSARTFAQLLKRDDAADLLDETLEEEREADVRLTEIAESMVNQRAMAESRGSDALTGTAGSGSGQS